jgi:hypothetical protein
MTKRPDQHNIDHDEASATDYKSRRRTEERARRDAPDDLEANRATTQTPNEAMETRRRQAEEGREDELERARRHTGDDEDDG